MNVHGQIRGNILITRNGNIICYFNFWRCSLPLVPRLNSLRSTYFDAPLYTMNVFLYCCAFIRLLISFPTVGFCSPHDIINLKTNLPCNPTPTNERCAESHAIDNQTLGEHYLRNQTFESEMPCMPDTCGATRIPLPGLSSGSSDAKVERQTTNPAVCIRNNGTIKTPPMNSLQKRWYLMHDPDDNDGYVACLSKIISMDGQWVHSGRGGRTTMQHFVYGRQRSRNAFASGVKGLWGCTSVIVASNAGTFVSHIWEEPTFDFEDRNFRKRSYHILRDGDPDGEPGQSVGFRNLTGRKEILSRPMRPVIFIITPRSTKRDRDVRGIQTELKYDAKVKILATALKWGISSEEPPYIIGYTRTSKADSRDDNLASGKAIVEVDQGYIHTNPRYGRPVPTIQGSWRLWVENRIEFEQQYSYRLPTS